MNERLKTVLVLFALMPFLVGGGGFCCTPFTTVFPAAVNAHVVLDPHNNTVDNPAAPAGTFTATGRRASIRVTRGGASASAFFTVLPGQPFNLGCDLTQTETRFVTVVPPAGTPGSAKPVNGWIPGPVLRELLISVGIPAIDIVGPADNVMITSVDHAACTMPTPPGDHAGVVGPGILSFHARMHLFN